MDPAAEERVCELNVEPRGIRPLALMCKWPVSAAVGAFLAKMSRREWEPWSTAKRGK